MASSAPWNIRPNAEALAVSVEKEATGHSRDISEESRKSFIDSSEDGEKVHELARAITQQSIKNENGEHINPFDGTDNPLLDPLSDKFNYKTWIKNLLGVQSRDPERYPARVAGVSYRNLSAHGFGDATDYQKTFGNYPLEVGGLFNKLTGRQHRRKIQILRNFDGLIRSGEMLVVLGRPGRFVIRTPFHKRVMF
jgi:ATP-binding cassette, subfamily G (WHITE), member 2, PDR